MFRVIDGKRSRHDGLPLAELLPGISGQRFINRSDGALELDVAGIAVRRNANARVRPVVHNDIAREQELRDFIRVRNIECNRAATTR